MPADTAQDRARALGHRVRLTPYAGAVIGECTAPGCNMGFTIAADDTCGGAALCFPCAGSAECPPEGRANE